MFGTTPHALVNLIEAGFHSGSGRVDAAPALLASQLRMRLHDGLDGGDATQLAERARVFGVNRLPPPKFVSFWELVVDAFKDPTVILLSLAGLLSLLLQVSTPSSPSDGHAEWIEGAAILVAVVIVVGVSSVTNYQKEGKFRELNTLKDDIKIRVIRGGSELQLSIFDLLVGDVALVETGDFIPADGVLFEGGPIKVDESHMTGESDDVVKSAGDASLLLSGSKVLEGFGRMLVLAVGTNAQQGKINAMVMSSSMQGSAADTGEEASGQGQDQGRRLLAPRASQAVEPQVLGKGTFLEKKLGVLAQQIGNVGMAAAAAVLLINWGGYTLQGLETGANLLDIEHMQRYLDYFITSVTVLVVAIPEGLPLAVTLALAFSVQRMLSDNNLVRHLEACETMACATTVCTDKTGTLTQNAMAVVRLRAGGRTYDVRRYKPAVQGPGLIGGSGTALGLEPSALGSMGGSGSGGGRHPAVAEAKTALSAVGSSAFNGSSGGSSSSSSSNGSSGGQSAFATRVSLDEVHLGLPAGLDLGPGLGSVPAASPDAWSPGSGGLPKHFKDLVTSNILLNSTASSVYTASGVRERSGNRTECALLEFAQGLEVGGAEAAARGAQVVEVLPFTSERKCMSTLLRVCDDGDGNGASSSGSNDSNDSNDSNGTSASTSGGDSSSSSGALSVGTAAQQHYLRLFTKGAAEIILERCKWQVDGQGNVVPLSASERQALAESSGEREGLRMMALAYRDLPVGSSLPPRDQLEQDLVLLALAGLQDPLRPDVGLAVSQCQRAGIAVRMLTGDNARTAASIAKKAGILSTTADVDVAVRAGATLAARARAWRDAGEQQAADPASPRGRVLTEQRKAAGLAGPNGRVEAEQGTAAGEAGPSGRVGVGAVGGKAPGCGRHFLDMEAEPLPSELVLEGQQLRQLMLHRDGRLDGRAFREVWPRLRVLARCSPQDKYLLVTTLKSLRAQAADAAASSRQAGPGETALEPVVEVVAMTGDGTNDAPALSAADVGFAMNSGTSIAKDAADILIMDDSFSSIVSAVKWGRNVFASITKFLQFQLCCNLVAVSTACMGALALQESPLSAVQMLWVNLIMDSLASLALATEAPTDAMLDLAPCRPDQELINATVLKHVLGQAAFQLAALLGLLFYGEAALGVDHATNNTLIFNAFVMMQLFNQVNSRKVHDEPNVLEGLTLNPYFLTIIASEAVLQYLIVQYGGSAFQTVPLDAPEWAACVGIGATTLLVRAGLAAVDVSTRDKGRAPGAGGAALS